MNEFTLIFRNDSDPDVKFSPEQMQGVMKEWQDWIGGIAAQNKLSSIGNRLGWEGKTLRPNNVVTDGPYVETKEMISGYIIVKTDSLEDALKLSQGCPILNVGGSVEIRNVIPMDM